MLYPLMEDGKTWLLGLIDDTTRSSLQMNILFTKSDAYITSIIFIWLCIAQEHIKWGKHALHATFTLILSTPQSTAVGSSTIIVIGRASLPVQMNFPLVHRGIR